tara:strand:+ start:1314 stop:1496 length:183 start_codon:yes stop_codon:yes gene_type:complete
MIKNKEINFFIILVFRGIYFTKIHVLSKSNYIPNIICTLIKVFWVSINVEKCTFGGSALQ